MFNKLKIFDNYLKNMLEIYQIIIKINILKTCSSKQ